MIVKALAKPMAKFVKTEAEHVAWLRKTCETIGQGSHYASVRLAFLTTEGRQSKFRVADLKHSEALELGTTILSEGLVLTVAVGVAAFEYERSSWSKAADEQRKSEESSTRESVLQARLDLIESQLGMLVAANAAQNIAIAAPNAHAQRRRWWLF